MDGLLSTIRKRSSPYHTTNQIKERPLPSLQSSPLMRSFTLACLVDEVSVRDASGLCVLSHIPYKQIHVLIETDSQQPIHRAVLDSDLQEPIPDVYFQIDSQAVRFFFSFTFFIWGGEQEGCCEFTDPHPLRGSPFPGHILWHKLECRVYLRHVCRRYMPPPHRHSRVMGT